MIFFWGELLKGYHAMPTSMRSIMARSSLGKSMTMYFFIIMENKKKEEL